MSKRTLVEPVTRRRLNWHSWPYFAWLFGAIVLVITLLVLWSTSAAAQTPRAQLAIKQVLSLRADPANGAQLFARHCASCHGPLALGNPAQVVPALAGQWSTYLVKQFVDTAEGDREVTEMHRVLARAELVGPQAMRDLASFISGLKPAQANEVGDGKRVVQGRQMYAAQCAFCHGASAQGAPDQFVPALAHQHYAYLLSQSRQLASGHRYSVGVDVISRFETLSLADLMAIADSVSRMSRTVSASVPKTPNGLSRTEQ